MRHGILFPTARRKCLKVYRHFSKGLFQNTICCPYCLPESGHLHKAVLLQQGPYIIEEVQVFKPPQPIRSLKLSIPKVQTETYSVYFQIFFSSIFGHRF